MTKIPDGVALRVGTTASVLVLTGTKEDDQNSSAPPVPTLLQ